MGSIARSGTWDEASSPAATRLARRFEDAWRDPHARNHRPDPGDFLPEGPDATARRLARPAPRRPQPEVGRRRAGPGRGVPRPLPRPRRRDAGRPLLRGVLPPRGGRPGPLPRRVRRAVPRPGRPAPPGLRHPRAGRQRRLDRPPRPRARADPVPRGRPDDRRLPPRRGAGPGLVRPGLPGPGAAARRPAGGPEGGPDRLARAADPGQAPAHAHRPGPLVPDRPGDRPAPALHALLRPGHAGQAPGRAPRPGSPRPARELLEALDRLDPSEATAGAILGPVDPGRSSRSPGPSPGGAPGWPRPWPMPTTGGSCTATSSRPTSW